MTPRIAEFFARVVVALSCCAGLPCPGTAWAGDAAGEPVTAAYEKAYLELLGPSSANPSAASQTHAEFALSRRLALSNPGGWNYDNSNGAIWFLLGQWQWLSKSKEDTAFALWSLKDGRIVSRPNIHSSRILAFRISSDGKTVISSSKRGDCVYWDLDSGKVKRRLVHFGSPLDLIALSANGGRAAATGTEGGTIRVWDLASGRMVWKQNLGKGLHMDALALSPKGDHLFYSTRDRWYSDPKAFLVDLTTGKAVWAEEEDDTISAACFAPDGLTYAFAKGLTINIHETKGGRLQKRLIYPNGGIRDTVSTLAFSPDGHRILVCNCLAPASILDLETGSILKTLHHAELGSFSADGLEVIVMGNKDWSATRWQLPAFDPMRPMDGFTPELRATIIFKANVNDRFDYAMAFSSDDRLLRIQSHPSYKDKAVIFDIESKTNVTLTAEEEAFRFQATIPYDVENVKTAGVVRLLDRKSGKVVFEAKKRPPPVRSINLNPSPDGVHALLSESGIQERDGRQVIVDVISGTEVYVLTNRLDWSCFSTDGKHLAGQVTDHDRNMDHRIEYIRVADGAVVGSRQGSFQEPLGLINNGLLLFRGWDTELYVWDMIKGKKMARFWESGQPIGQAVFSHDETCVASCGAYGEVCIWKFRHDSR